MTELNVKSLKESRGYEAFGHPVELVKKFLAGELKGLDISQYDKDSFSRVCARLGLELPKEFYNTVEVDHIVEIFDLSGKSLYKNLYYFQFSNYSIEDHLTQSFFELFSRPREIEQQIMDYLTKAFVEKDFGLKKPNIPFHYLKERHSQNRSIFGLDIKTFQLLKTQESGELFGFANMIKVHQYKMNSLIS